MGDVSGDGTPTGTFYDLKDSDRKFTMGGHVTGSGIFSLSSSDTAYKVLNALETETTQRAGQAYV